MYKIEKQAYGYKLTFSGAIKADEMQTWVKSAESALAGQAARSFGVFVDMREMKPLESEAQAVMVKGQMLFKQKGMERSVVILSTPVIALQFRRLAKESGIYKWERYLDTQTTQNYQKVGEEWLVHGIDPDRLN